MCECFIRVDCFLHCTLHQCHFRFVLFAVVCDLRRIGLHASSVDVLGAVEERVFEAVGGKVHGDKLPLRTAVVAAGQGSGYDEGGTAQTSGDAQVTPTQLTTSPLWQSRQTCQTTWPTTGCSTCRMLWPSTGCAPSSTWRRLHRRLAQTPQPPSTHPLPVWLPPQHDSLVCDGFSALSTTTGQTSTHTTARGAVQAP